MENLLHSTYNFIVSFFGMGNAAIGLFLFTIWAIYPFINRKNK